MKIDDKVFFDCFTSSLNEYANLNMSYNKFDDIYSALIHAYKTSFVKFQPNVPNRNQFYPGYQYRSVVRKFIIRYYDNSYPYHQTEKKPIIIYHDKIRKAIFIQRQFRKYLQLRLKSALIIQKQFRESISNPYHLMCKRRLLREFKEMGDFIF